jgi:hypothetical protein
MKATITMSSELYGEETFEYDTIKEANAGFSRLMKSCNECYAKDKVERELSLESSNGKIHRTAKVAGEIVEK